MNTNVKFILQKLIIAGFEGYVVGGSVRDHILQRSVKDIDIATNATPEQVMSLFPENRVIGTGLKHGTVTILVNGESYEVTTFRIDQNTDGRHAEVKFATTLGEDVVRRDLTINALAMTLDGTILDYVGGVADLQNKIIRTVGVPFDRFNEDYLRMLRAIRFVSQLGFDLDPSTQQAITALASHITQVSAERQRDELIKILNGEFVLQALDLLVKTGLLQQIIPELIVCVAFPQNKYHTYDVFTHMALSCAQLPREKPLLRLAALFHDVGKPGTCQNKGTPEASFWNHEVLGATMVETIMARLRFSTDETQYVSNLVRHHMFQYDDKMKDGTIRRFVNAVGMTNIPDLIQLKWADRVGKGPQHHSTFNPNTYLKQRIDRLVAESNVFGLKDMAVNGTDLMTTLQLTPGPIIGQLLNQLLEKVLDDSSLNTKEKLLEEARSILNYENTKN